MSENEAPLVAGIELGGTKIICILARGPDEIVERCASRRPGPTRRWRRSRRCSTGGRGFVAIGIASFGPVSIDRARAITATSPRPPSPAGRAPISRGGWSGDTACPTGFHTDVVGAALAEARWGAAKGLPDIAYVTVGTGVGVGLIAGGRRSTG